MKCINSIFLVFLFILSGCITKENDYSYRTKMISNLINNKQNIINKNSKINDVISKIGYPSFSDIDSKSMEHWYYLCSNTYANCKKDAYIVLVLDFNKEGSLCDIRHNYQPVKGIFAKKITKNNYRNSGYILNLLKRLMADKRDRKWQ